MCAMTQGLGSMMFEAAVAAHTDGPDAAVAAHTDGPHAAVAAQDDVPAEAVALSLKALEEMRVTQPFRLNNVALKWIRDSNENPPGHPTTASVDLTDTDPLQIGVIQKTTGMDYSFKQGETTPWSWRQRFAALTSEAKEKVLGCNPRLGVVRITCAPVIGSYDHKRWHAALHIGRPYGEGAAVPVWDFFVTRTNGTMVRFHTNYSNNKVEVADLMDPRGLPGPPRKGKGRSDGPGTYRSKTTGNYNTVVAEVVLGRDTATGTANSRGGGGGADETPKTHGGGGGASAAPDRHSGGSGAAAAQGSHSGGRGDAGQASGGSGDAAAQGSQGGGPAIEARRRVRFAPDVSHSGRDGNGADGSEGWEWRGWGWHGWESRGWQWGARNGADGTDASQWHTWQ